MIAPARVAAYDVLRMVGAGRQDSAAGARESPVEARRRTRPRARGRDCYWRPALAGGPRSIVSAATGRPLARLDPEVLDVLRLTLFQLLHLDRVPASAAVNDAVSLAKRAGKRSAAAVWSTPCSASEPAARTSCRSRRVPPTRTDMRRRRAPTCRSTLSHPSLAGGPLGSPVRLRGGRSPGPDSTTRLHRSRCGSTVSKRRRASCRRRPGARRACTSSLAASAGCVGGARGKSAAHPARGRRLVLRPGRGVADRRRSSLVHGRASGSWMPARPRAARRRRWQPPCRMKAC